MTLGQGNLLYNRYRVVEILGRGGMGAVYRATDESLGVEVAVKENLFTTDDYARQFRMEAVIMAGIRHPNLPRVSDHFVIDDMGQYLVMDYIEGDDLRQRMDKKGSILEKEAIQIGSAACDALIYLHSRKPPILHRDIKLGNIKLGSNGQVYLVDFGLAKMGWAHEETMAAARAMTPGYSPPEQYGSAHTDARSDIYSLGATLYAALTGAIPEDSLMRVMDGLALTPLRNIRPEISERLAGVIEKAMETSAANRYQSAEEFKEALLGADNAEYGGVKGKAAIKSPEYVPEKRKKLVPIFWRLAGVFVLLLVVAGGAIFMNPAYQNRLQAAFFPVPSASPTVVSTLAATATVPAAAAVIVATETSVPSPTPNPTRPISTATSTATSAVTSTATSIPSPTATLLAVAQPTPQGGGMGQIAYASIVGKVAQIFLMNTDGSELRQLTNATEGACSFDWSPDGKKLIYSSPCDDKRKDYPGSSLYVLDIEKDSTSSLLFKASGDFEPAWSPDGKQIAFTSLRDGMMQIYVYRLGDQSLKRLTALANSPQAHYPAWSPDSSRIAYTVIRSGLLQIWTMSADGSNQKQLVRTGGAFSEYLPIWSPDGATLLFSETNAGLNGLSSLQRYTFKTNLVDALFASNLVSSADAHFSPDGAWIVYEGSDSKTQNIYIWHLFDGEPKRLTSSALIDFDAVWRPGGVPAK